MDRDPKQYGGGKGFRKGKHREPTDATNANVTPTCKGLDHDN